MGLGRGRLPLEMYGELGRGLPLEMYRELGTGTTATSPRNVYRVG